MLSAAAARAVDDHAEGRRAPRAISAARSLSPPRGPWPRDKEPTRKNTVRGRWEMRLKSVPGILDAPEDAKARHSDDIS